MDAKNYAEKTATSIASLDKDQLKTKIKNFHGSPRLDFTDDYLEKLNVDRLRHILLAALLTSYKK